MPCQVYLLTTTTFQRRRIFAGLHCAHMTCRIIHAPATWGEASMLAWVLMPDHWHGLLQLGQQPLPRVVERFKANVTRQLHYTLRAWFRAKCGDCGFHDHALRADEGVRRAAQYIVANPVHAGLVDHARDYPYWDAAWLDSDTSVPLA